MEKRDVLMVILFVLVIASLVISVYNTKKISENKDFMEDFIEKLSDSFKVQQMDTKLRYSIIENELNITFKEKIKEMPEAEKASLAA